MWVCPDRVCTSVWVRPDGVCTSLWVCPDRVCTSVPLLVCPDCVCTSLGVRPDRVCTSLGVRPDRVCTSLCVRPDRVCTSMSPEDGLNGARPTGGSQTPLFACSSDWDREIKRTGAAEWRVCSVNQGYGVSPRWDAHVRHNTSGRGYLPVTESNKWAVFFRLK